MNTSTQTLPPNTGGEALQILPSPAKALAVSAKTWFIVTVIGQWLFATYVTLFYGGAAARGDFEAWNKVLPHGIVEGQALGNIAVAMHLILAVVIIVGGPLQLLPQLRQRLPRFHRINGRIYMACAMILSIGGIYMVLYRGTVGDNQAAIQLNAVLIMVCAFMATRWAILRQIPRHQRWALRLFLVVGGVWYFRIGLMAWIMANGGAVGFDPKTFTGPFLTFLGYAQYLIPLALLELYFAAKNSRRAIPKWSMAALLLALSLLTLFGTGAASLGMWLPRI